MKIFNIDTLKLVREYRGITQKELSENLQIEHGTLSKIEKGILSTNKTLVDKISSFLDFPEDIFFQEIKKQTYDFYYKRNFAASVKRMKQNFAEMTMAAWHLSLLMDEVELPSINLPSWDIDVDGAPNRCADYLRSYWRTPNDRIINLSKILEDNGIVIIPLSLTEMDGYSQWLDGVMPIIFINKRLLAEDFRFVLAMELGHLIMHYGKKINPDRNIEEEAMRFAKEFLMPEFIFKAYCSSISLEKLADLKLYFRLSMQVILKNARAIQKITENQYRYILKQMTNLGYQKREPVILSKEQPMLLKEILSFYLQDLGYSKSELAGVLKLTEREMDYLYFDKLRLIKSGRI